MAGQVIAGAEGIRSSRTKISTGSLEIYYGREVIMGFDRDAWRSGKDQRGFRKVLQRPEGCCGICRESRWSERRSLQAPSKCDVKIPGGCRRGFLVGVKLVSKFLDIGLQSFCDFTKCPGFAGNLLDGCSLFLGCGRNLLAAAAELLNAGIDMLHLGN